MGQEKFDCLQLPSLGRRVQGPVSVAVCGAPHVRAHLHQLVNHHLVASLTSCVDGKCIPPSRVRSIEVHSFLQKLICLVVTMFLDGLMKLLVWRLHGRKKLSKRSLREKSEHS
jgi:hypothetical protein